MRNDPRVVIIIVNWNGKNLLKNCLISLKKNTEYSNYKVIVVDNGSTDGSVEFLKRKFPWVDVLALDRNYGFAGGNNRGIVYALNKYNPDYILLLNNDILIIQKDWLRKMVEVAESDKKIGIVGCKLIYPDGSIQHIGTKIDAFGIFWLNPNISNFPKILKVDAILGACFLIKRSVINKIGLLDESFHPFQHEETDYCLRARKAGYDVYTILNVSVIHIHGATMKKVNEEYFKFINKKNEIKLLLFNCSLHLIMLYCIFNLFRCIFRREYKNFFNLKIRSDWKLELNMYIKAWLVNLKNFKEIIERRLNRTKKLWWSYEKI